VKAYLPMCLNWTPVNISGLNREELLKDNIKYLLLRNGMAVLLMHK
jgi:hypothetical protein